MNKEPVWLDWAKKLNSIAQAGLTYSKSSYDLERYKQIQNISIDILNRYTDMDHQKIRNLFNNEVGYQTPKINVRAAIFTNDKVLMIREEDRWSMGSSRWMG